MAIGRDLLDLPFAEMVRNLAVAIADGQTALDRNSLETLRVLAETDVDVLTDITEIIEPDVRTVDVPSPRGGPPQSVEVTGARIRASGAPTMPMNMVQAGLLPTFYQFTEATIEVRLSITMREDRETEERGRRTSPGPTLSPFLGLGYSRAYTSTVDFRTQNKYSYAAQGASHLRATMRPVPPPPRLEPTFTTVNTLTQPPTVTATPR